MQILRAYTIFLCRDQTLSYGLYHTHDHGVASELEFGGLGGVFVGHINERFGNPVATPSARLFGEHDLDSLTLRR